MISCSVLENAHVCQGYISAVHGIHQCPRDFKNTIDLFSQLDSQLYHTGLYTSSCTESQRRIYITSDDPLSWTYARCNSEPFPAVNIIAPIIELCKLIHVALCK